MNQAPLLSEDARLVMTIAGATAAFIAALALLGRTQSHLRKKGYRSPLHGVALVLLYTAALAAGIGALVNVEANGTASVTARAAVLYLVLPGVGLPLLMLVTAHLLPTRTRTFGARRTRVNWEVLLLLVLGAGTPAVALIAIFSDWVDWYMALGIWGVAVLGPAAACLQMAARASQPTLEDVLAKDPRPPVLYLRAFGREWETFVELTIDELQAHPPAHHNRPSHQRLGASFEEYFARAIGDGYGPFAALGNPEDYLAPRGAARTYADDAGWKHAFEDLARRAVWIVMEVDHSDDVQWELQRLRELGLHHKLFVFTRPPPKQGWRYVRHSMGRVMERLPLLARPEPVSWPAFAAVLSETGYRADAADPGLGAVIAFDDAGAAVRIRSGAYTPADYLAAVDEWLRTRRLDAGSPLEGWGPERPSSAEGVLAKLRGNQGA